MRHFFLQTKYRLLAIQLISLSMLIIFLAIRGNWQNLISALLGGIAWIIPSLYFTHRFFATKLKHNPQKALNILLIGEGVKLLLSISMIVLCILLFKIKIWGFLGGYATTVMSSLFLPLIYKNKNL